MKPISFLSDFGTSDEFVGVVKGVIARIEPSLRVIDITHGVRRGDVRAGALTLLRAVQYMPAGVILAVVDPGVGSERRALAVETPLGFFVGPDNGLLAPAVAMVGGAVRAVALENPAFHVPSEGGSTFDGRDVFGPAAAVLASEQASLTELGPEVAVDTLTPLLLPLVEDSDDGGVKGVVWWVDQFGNCQTNIAPSDLTQRGIEPGTRIQIGVGSSDYFAPLAGSYSDAEPGQLLVHVDSYGLVALAVRDGSAAGDLQLSEGSHVTLRKSERS